LEVISALPAVQRLCYVGSCREDSSREGIVTKWEYMSAWVDQNWEVKTIVGWEEKGEKLPPFVEFLNIVGAVGWEMIGVVPVEVGHRVFFKRPK
jgi:hypothetical protein